MRKGQPWRITYRGWRITHDPLGHLACYRLAGSAIRWCYFGCSVDVIKMEIDRREALVQQLAELDT